MADSGPHLHRDRRRRICAGTGLTPANICTGTGAVHSGRFACGRFGRQDSKTDSTDRPMREVRVRSVGPCLISTGTGLAPALSAPRLGSPRTTSPPGLPHLHWDWARSSPQLLRRGRGEPQSRFSYGWVEPGLGADMTGAEMGRSSRPMAPALGSHRRLRRVVKRHSASCRLANQG